MASRPGRRVRWRHRVIIAFVAMTLCSGAIVGVASVAASPDQQSDTAVGADSSVPIEACGTLTTPGRYVLVEDLAAGNRESCLNVTVSDVVIDGNDHEITDTGNTTRFGILAEDVANVTVRNVTAAGLTRGLFFDNVSGGVIADSTFTSNFDAGVWVRGVDNVTLQRLALRRNAIFGIRVGSSWDTAIRDNQLNQNGAGVSIARSIRGTVRRNEIHDGELGVAMSLTERYHIENNQIRSHRIGVGLAVSDGNVIEDNRFEDNFYGVRVDDSDALVVRGNRIATAEFGVFFVDSNGGVIADNRIASNRTGVVLTFESDGNTVINNAIESAGSGVNIVRSAHNRVLENVIVATTADIETARAENTTVSGNEVTIRTPTPRPSPTFTATVPELTPRPTDERASLTGLAPSEVALLGVVVLLGVAALVYRRR